jgi:hypothetical protein
MYAYTYAIEVPLADGSIMYEICRADTPEKAGELVRILLSAGASVPSRVQVVVHPVSRGDDPFAGQ